MLLPILLGVPAATLAQDNAPSVAWQWSCRLMEPITPGHARFADRGANRVGELLIHFDRTNDEVFIEIDSDVFSDFLAERQPRVDGDVRDEVSVATGEPENPAWIVETAGGPLAIQVFGKAIVLTRFYSDVVAGHIEEELVYEAVGICDQVRKAV